jgi:hypothetical protein
MSEENVEIVRAAYEAFERGDLEAISRLHDPAIEWQTSAEDPDAATHRGPEAVRRYFEGYMETSPDSALNLRNAVHPTARCSPPLGTPGEQGRAAWTWTGGSRLSTRSKRG